MKRRHWPFHASPLAVVSPSPMPIRAALPEAQFAYRGAERVCKLATRPEVGWWEVDRRRIQRTRYPTRHWRIHSAPLRKRSFPDSIRPAPGDRLTSSHRSLDVHARHIRHRAIRHEIHTHHSRACQRERQRDVHLVQAGCLLRLKILHGHRQAAHIDHDRLGVTNPGGR
jgi:hypothetical protein